MFARVYPLQRLPRRFDVFDYHIPDGMHVAVGDCVRIPFHGRAMFGIVAAVAAESHVTGAVNDLTDVYMPSAMSASDIARIRRLAADIAQSPATLCYHLFGTLSGENLRAPSFVRTPKRTLSVARKAAEHLARLMQRLPDAHEAVVQCSRESAFLLAGLLRRRVDGQLLILLPRERDADILARTVAFDTATCVLHGKTAPKERERILRAWRSGRVRTLIGTRQAALLPAERVSAVLVMDCGTDDHFNDRRNPRFDTRIAGHRQARQHGAWFVACDVLPRPEEYAAFPERHCSPQTDTITLVDLRKREEASGHPLLSETLMNALQTALRNGKKVLLFHNRKGVAKRVQCRQCGHIPVCACGGIYALDEEPGRLTCRRCSASLPSPDTCPSCATGSMGLRGIGNAHLAEVLRTLFPDSTIGHIEKGAQLSDADILLATEYFFSSVVEPFGPKIFGVVADVALDLSMHPDDFRSNETTARKLHRLQAFAERQGAACIVQTWLTDLAVTMRDPDRFLAEETALRLRYGLPPGRAIVTVRNADADALTALSGAYFAPSGTDAAETRLPYEHLMPSLAALTTLPDIAVISVDRTYDQSDRLA